MENDARQPEPSWEALVVIGIAIAFAMCFGFFIRSIGWENFVVIMGTP